jgi:hypothetical protein
MRYINTPDEGMHSYDDRRVGRSGWRAGVLCCAAESGAKAAPAPLMEVL